MDAARTGGGLGHGDDQVRHLHQLHQNLGHVIIQRHHETLCQNTVVDLPRTGFDQDHHSQIHDHKGQRIHQIGDPAGLLLLTLQIGSIFLKGFCFRIFHGKGAQNTYTGQILTGGGSHLIEAGLHPLVHGHGDQHNAKHYNAQHRNHADKYQCRFKINGKCHNHGAKHHKGRPQQQPQRQVHTVLYLIDIGCKPCDQRGNANGIDLCIRKTQNMLQHHMAQTGCEAYCGLGRKILGSDGAAETDQAQ